MPIYEFQDKVGFLNLKFEFNHVWPSAYKNVQNRKGKKIGLNFKCFDRKSKCWLNCWISVDRSFEIAMTSAVSLLEILREILTSDKHTVYLCTDILRLGAQQLDLVSISLSLSALVCTSTSSLLHISLE